MASNIANQRSEDGLVFELLDGERIKDGEIVGIIWTDFYRENHKVVIISEIVPHGTREKAHIKINHHGISVPVSLLHLISMGVEVSKKPVW